MHLIDHQQNPAFLECLCERVHARPIEAFNAALALDELEQHSRRLVIEQLLHMREVVGMHESVRIGREMRVHLLLPCRLERGDCAPVERLAQGDNLESFLRLAILARNLNRRFVRLCARVAEKNARVQAA